METAPLIFVVDDTEAARRATVLVLERAGFRVAEAADGTTALRSIPELSPDLVLLDAVLPDIGGIEVLRRLRAEPRFALLPIVILSSQLKQAADQAEGLNAGADGYIARPISNVELVARVRSLLRNQELSRQLRESEARFRELITQQSDGLLVVDAEGCIRFANPAAARIFGRRSEDLVGYPFGFPISSGATVQIDVPGAAAPGRILEFSASATRWDDRPAHLISLRDVTAHRLAERNLRESEKRLSGIFQQSAAGMFLASLDGRYLRVNQRFCAIMGCTEAEILARNSTETTHPDDRPLESSMTATMLAGGLSSPSWDKRYLRRDGSPIWTNLTLSLLRDEEGDPQQYVGVVIDITQRKAADELVRTRARQQETIARIGFEATRTTTLQGIFDFATGAVAEALGVELCKVLQLAPDGSHLRLVSGVGWQAGLIGVGTVGVDRESQAGFTLNSDGAIYVNDFTQETRFTAPPLLRDHEVVSGLSVKILLRDRPWGVLGAHCRTVRAFNDVDADFMQAVATLLAVVIERLAVQRTLTESEARMRDAQRIAHLGNWELDITENKLSWSEEVFRIFGVDPSTFAATYESFMSFVHPDDRDSMQAAQQAVLSGRGRLDFEHRLIRPDGSIRHVRERGELISDANGQPVALTGTVLDITDLRAAQSHAERMNALLTDAQRIADMGSWEMDPASGRLVWSEETCRLFGIRPEEFGGTFESFTGFILPEDMAAYNAVHAGITPEAPLLEAEYRIRRPDGEVRWMFERGRVTFDADGKVIRRLGVVMDITGRKRAEEQLQSGSKRLTLATQAGGVGIWDYEVACNRLIWDAQMYRLYGIEPGQFSGAYEAWTAGVHPEDRQRGDEEIQQALRGERNFDTEFRVLWPDGSTHHIRALAIVERDAAGSAVRMVGTNWDITGRKRAETELREREQLLRIAGRIARVGAWSVDFPEVRITWSDEVCAIHDMPAGTVPALDRALDYYTPESRPVIESAFSLCAHEGTPFDVEIELQSAKGQRRWVRSIGQAERDQTGAIRRVSGAFQDITDQKLAQKKQLQDGSLRRIAGAIAKIGGWSLSVPDYHLDWSEEIFDIVEYPRGPVPSLEKALELYPEPWQSQLGAAITACATGGAPIDMELMIRSAKGRLFWARCKAEAVRDSAGRITQVQGAFQDISAQKAADAMAAELGNRLINTLESITDAFFTVDSDWRFTYLNGEAETLLERKRAELLGQNVWEKFPEAVGSEFYQAYHRARETQQTVSFESFYPPLNKWFEVRAHPSEEGLAVYFSDVTERRRTVDALRASESKFRQLSESNILGLLFWTSQGGITDANDAFLRMVGYTREELTSGQIDWRTMTPPEYLAQDERVLAELAAGGNCPPFEKEYFHKDGHRVAIVLGATTLDGAKDQGICYVVDISAQKQAKEQLLRNQALLRMAGRAARLGGWSLHLASGKVTWSEETCHIHEEPPGFQPVLETAISYYVPAYRGMVTERVRACLETGQPFDFEAEIVTAKGHRLWVRAVGEAVRDAGGVITGMEGAFQDITPLKLAEQSVEESQRRFRQLAESMPYIVWTARPDGMVDYANRVFFDYTGVPQDESPETYWQACLHPDDLAACIQEWGHCIRDETLYSIEFRVRRAQDGAYRWFRVQATPVRDAEGRLIKWYGTGLDVDETKRLQQEATGLADRLTTTFESLTDAFFALDTAWRFSYVNDRAVELMRRSRDELIGKAVWELFPEAVGSTFEQQYRQAVATGISVTFEEYFPPLATWFEVRAFPSSEGLAVYFHDVTERRRNREILRQSEERFRLLARATNDAIWDWNLITNELWWNEGYETLFGYARADVDPTIRSWTDQIHPEDLARVTEDVHRVIDHGGDAWSGEYRFRCQDGRYAYVLDRGHVIRDATGKPVRMIGGMTDLSDRRAAEERLQEQAALLDKAQDAILVRDLEHRVLYWNRSAERLYGWTAAEAVGRSIRELLYRDATAFDEATRNALARGEWVGEIEQYTKAGEKISVEGHWTLVRDNRGNPKSILAINTDITQRKKLEQQFLRAQRMESIGTLAGGIAHDLNNMLAPISMGVDLLRRYQQDTKSHAIIDTIGRSAKRGADLVKQVLSFARGVEGERVSIRVPHLIGEIASIVENTFPKNILLDASISDSVWPISGDPTQMNQVILNLVVNARDAMPDGGKLTITADNVEVDEQYAVMNRGVSPGRYVVISVTDTGVGIPREIMDRIFDPFFTTKEIGKGTGLGLATVMGIVRSHGGLLNVYSEPGKGSTFKIYLPAQAEEDAGTEKKAADVEHFPRGNGELILVVDDEASILDITKQTLEAFGYRVITADDGAQAIGEFALARDRIKLVLTDMMMPVMDGPALIAALRRIDPHVRIIAASGLNANGNVAKAANLGVKHFLPKPYSADTLLVALQRVLSENTSPSSPQGHLQGRGE